jgi:hypothetical protein
LSSLVAHTCCCHAVLQIHLGRSFQVSGTGYVVLL